MAYSEGCISGRAGPVDRKGTRGTLLTYIHNKSLYLVCIMKGHVHTYMDYLFIIILNTAIQYKAIKSCSTYTHIQQEMQTV